MFAYSYWFLQENVCFGGKWHATGSHMTYDIIKTPKAYKYQGGLFIFQNLDLIVVETLCCLTLHRYFDFVYFCIFSLVLLTMNIIRHNYVWL